MKVNNISQNFGARIIVNDSLKKALEGIGEAVQLGNFDNVPEFINAINLIKETEDFDTFEIQAQTPEEYEKRYYHSDKYAFEIKTDGKPVKCENRPAFSHYGGHQGSRAIGGIIQFAKEYLNLNSDNLKITKAHQNFKEINADIAKHQKSMDDLRSRAEAVGLYISRCAIGLAYDVDEVEEGRELLKAINLAIKEEEKEISKLRLAQHEARWQTTFEYKPIIDELM